MSPQPEKLGSNHLNFLGGEEEVGKVKKILDDAVKDYRNENPTGSADEFILRRVIPGFAANDSLKHFAPLFQENLADAYAYLAEEHNLLSVEKKHAWDKDKDRIRTAVDGLDISKMGDDPRLFSGKESDFADAVKDYLDQQGLLEGNWIEKWETEFVKGRIARMGAMGEGGSFFEGLDVILNQKFQEAQEVVKQEQILLDRFPNFLDPNHKESFLSDEYLSRHSIEKALAEGKYKNNDGKKLMMRVFQDQKIDPKIQEYLARRMGGDFQKFCGELQEAYDKRLEEKQQEFDVLFDQVFSGVAIDEHDPEEIRELKEMIYTSAKNSRSINQLNDWFEDDKQRFIKYKKCVDMRVADEKIMMEDIKEIGDPQLEEEHKQLRQQYQTQRKEWSGGAYYSPGDQWMYVRNMAAKVKMRKQQMERENNSMQSGLESRFEGGAFDWGDNEKLGKRMQKYLGGLLEKAPTLVEKEQLLRGLDSRFPTLQSQLQAMHGLWDGMEKEVGKDNIDKSFLSRRDTLWKKMLGQIMPRETKEFAPDRWNISDQLSGLRTLVGEIRAERVKKLDEEQKQKDVEEKIKNGDISELAVDDDRLVKREKFDEVLLKSWGYTKSQFATAVGGDKSKTVLKKLHTQWEQSHEKHWEGVVIEQTSRLNRKVDTLPGEYAAVGKFFIDGMKKQAGPDKPVKKRHEWLLKNEPAILDSVAAMDRYVREYDTLMTPEFRDFVHKDQPPLGQKLNGIWKELTGRVADGQFGKLGSNLGGYDSKTKSLYQQCQKAYEKHLKEKEQEELEEREKQEQEEADQKLEKAFQTGKSGLDTRFNFFLRRHQAVQAQRSGGATATATGASGFANEAEFKKSVLKGLTGLDAYEDKEYFDEWVKEKFKTLEEGADDEADVFAKLGVLDKQTEAKRKQFEDAGYPIDDARQLELLDKYNIRPDYLGRTGLKIDQLTKGLERLDRLSAESGKVGYIDQMMKENSLNSTGVFGTMVIGMLSVMNPNDFDTWKSDLRKMDFKMGKPGKEDAVLLMNSLFTNDRLMSQVNKDLSDLKSRFVSEGLKLINVDLKDILKDKEAAALEEILEELQAKEEQERQPDTPVEEVEGYFELGGAEISEQEAVMAQLAAYRFDPKVSSKGLSGQHLNQGLERIALLEQVQAFAPLDKVLREGTQNGYLSNHLFESLAIISSGEFKQWETQVRGLNLSGLSEEQKAYEMLQLLFDQGTLDRIAALEGSDSTAGASAKGEEGSEKREESDEEVEKDVEGALSVEGEEVDVGHTINLEDGVTVTASQGDDATVTVSDGEERSEKGEERDDVLSDEQIDAVADQGHELIEDRKQKTEDGEEITDEAIDEQADEGDELLEIENEEGEESEELDEDELELVDAFDDEGAESVEGGDDLGAQSVTESGEIDGGDEDEETESEDLPDLQVDGDGAEIDDEMLDSAQLEEMPYATADDFADDEDGEEGSEKGEESEELDEDEDADIEEALTEEEQLEEELAEQEAEEALEQEEAEQEAQEELEEQEQLEEELAEQEALEAELAEQEEQEAEEAESAAAEALAAEQEALEAEEEEKAQEELEEQEQLEEELAEQEAEEVLEQEEAEQEALEEELAEQEAEEELEAQEAEEAQAEQEALEAEEAEAEELEQKEAEEEQEQLEEELAEQEAQEAEEAELALDTAMTLEEQTELVSEIQDWSENEGWQLGVAGEVQAANKLKKGEILDADEQEKLEASFDTAKEQQREELEKREEEATEQEKLEAEEELQSQEEDSAAAEALADEQEAEKKAEVERMLAEFVELMVGEQEKAEMDRKKEEAEQEERKEQVLELIADSARTESAEGGLDLDGVLDIFREDVADFGQNRVFKKIYHSKDVLQKARGMMEYFLSQDMYQQLLKLNMRSTSMLSEDGWHFFAELYGDVYVTRIMTMQEIVRRFYHYVSILEDGDVTLEVKLPKALLEADIANSESVYRQLVGLYHMHKKQDRLTKVVVGGNKKYLDIALGFGKRTELGDIEFQVKR